jgi:hypothetical protein
MSGSDPAWHYGTNTVQAPGAHELPQRGGAISRGGNLRHAVGVDGAHEVACLHALAAHYRSVMRPHHPRQNTCCPGPGHRQDLPLQAGRKV